MPEPANHQRFVPTQRSGLRRLIKAFRARPDLGQVGVAVLVGAVGFAAVVHVRVDEDTALDGARRADLAQIWQELQRRSDRLESEISELGEARLDLLTAQDSEQAALEQARTRQGQLAVLAGTVPASGPGIVTRISEIAERQTTASTLLTVVQALREGGAEAIEIKGGNDEVVRIGVDSYFLVAEGDAAEVDGVRVELPFVLTAIGEPVALEASVTFASSVEYETLDQHDDITIDAVREPPKNEYARPATDDD
jgi:uncharacterized protein YlxW (UPF0749 family)